MRATTTVRTAIGILLACVAGACGDGSCSNAPAALPCGGSYQSPGALTITTITTGESQDVDGYLCTSALGEDRMDRNDEMHIGGVEPEVYAIKLSDVADNCTVAQNPIYVFVNPDHTSEVRFEITCRQVLRVPPLPPPPDCPDTNPRCKLPQ